MKPWHEHDACELAEAVRSGAVAASEVLEHHLARIEAAAPLGAFVFTDPDRARHAAAAVDRTVALGRDPGPLAGVPFGVKCLEDVAGWPHTMASRALASRVATTTSTQVTRLISAGAVVVGLTASPELGGASHTASELYGVCRNPWRPELTPGGSSGGSAAAVAAGLVPLATGSDSGGSLRIPAAYSGVFGFKGTYGRIPRGPGYVGMPNIRNYGANTRSVRDTARFLDVVAGADATDPLSLPKAAVPFETALENTRTAGLVARWSPGLGFTACDPAVVEHVHAGATELARALNLRLHERDVVVPDPEQAWRTLATPDAVALFGPLMPGAHDQVGPFVQAILAGAGGLRATDFAEASVLRAQLDAALVEAFDGCDVLLLPCVSCPAFAAEGPPPAEIDGRPVSMLGSVGLTYPFNLSGHPAASVPVAPMDGLPMGLQIVTRRHADALVLAVAHAWERARPWAPLASQPR